MTNSNNVVTILKNKIMTKDQNISKAVSILRNETLVNIDFNKEVNTSHQMRIDASMEHEPPFLNIPPSESIARTINHIVDFLDIRDNKMEEHKTYKLMQEHPNMFTGMCPETRKNIFYDELLEKFKPNLIPNNKNGFNPLEAIKNNVSDYHISEKLDGVCCVLLDGKVLGRSLKPIKNIYLQKALKMASMLFFNKGIILHGELYRPNTPFNAIESYCNTVDVTSNQHRADLLKERDLNKVAFTRKYGKATLDQLTTHEQGFKLYVFDCFVIENPTLGYEDRMNCFKRALHDLLNNSITRYYIDPFISHPTQYKSYKIKDVENILDDVISRGGEGLVLSHKDRVYKFGKHTLKQAQYFKLKDNQNEYDGMILDVEEGTQIKNNVKSTINELGRSVTSKKKGDRKHSGIAKGFKVMYKGKPLTVLLKGFNNDQKKELLDNKTKYIGRWIKYTAMKPIKDVPRHAVFDTFRDDK